MDIELRLMPRVGGLPDDHAGYLRPPTRPYETMTEDQQQRSVDHIARFLGRKPCPVCDLQVQWRLQNDVVVMLTVLDDGIDGDSGVQVIVATCPNCSYTIPFNAAHAGIVV